MMRDQKNKIKYGLSIVIGFFIFSISHSFALTSFETDGCTMAPDGTFTQPTLWRHCCVEHDLWFWAGGTQAKRELADLQLKSCIQIAAGETLANIFWMGVKVGSMSPYKLASKQWGNGWGTEARYQSLSVDEIQLLIHVLEGSLPEVTDEMKKRLLETIRDNPKSL